MKPTDEMHGSALLIPIPEVNINTLWGTFVYEKGRKFSEFLKELSEIEYLKDKVQPKFTQYEQWRFINVSFNAEYNNVTKILSKKGEIVVDTKVNKDCILYNITAARQLYYCTPYNFDIIEKQWACTESEARFHKTLLVRVFPPKYICINTLWGFFTIRKDSDISFFNFFTQLSKIIQNMDEEVRIKFVQFDQWRFINLNNKGEVREANTHKKYLKIPKSYNIAYYIMLY